MPDAPPPIPNPPVHPGALRAPDFDYSKLELRVLASMTDGDLSLLPWQQEVIDRLGRQEARIAIDPALPGTDKTVVLVGRDAQFFILDEILARSPITEELIHGHYELEGKLTGLINEELLKALQGIKDVKPEATADLKPDNRKQRRIDAAKERRKPRGQRKRMILDIETYDTNRSKDWLHG